MSHITIYCRDGACNVPGHTRTNCTNRYRANRIIRLDEDRIRDALGSPAEVADVDRACQ